MGTLLRYAALASLVLSSVACGSAAEELSERVVEEAAGDGVDVERDGDEVRIETSEGVMQVGVDTLPEGFPDSMPIPDDHTVLTSTSSAEAVAVNLETPVAFDDLVALYENELPEGGWSIEGRTEHSDESQRMVQFVVTGNGWTGAVGINHATGGTPSVYITLDRG